MQGFNMIGLICYADLHISLYVNGFNILRCFISIHFQHMSLYLYHFVVCLYTQIYSIHFNVFEHVFNMLFVFSTLGPRPRPKNGRKYDTYVQQLCRYEQQSSHKYFYTSPFPASSPALSSVTMPLKIYIYIYVYIYMHTHIYIYVYVNI